LIEERHEDGTATNHPHAPASHVNVTAAKGVGVLVLLALLVVATAAHGASQRPVRFVQPTAIEQEPAGTLLVVENDPGRLLRVDPRSGEVTVVVRSVARPYAVVRTSGGRVYFSAANRLRRVDHGGALTVVASADSDIGPVAAAPGGTLYFATGAHVYRVSPGSSPAQIGGRERLAAPHGLAVAADGSVLVSDTGNNRIVRIAPPTGAVTVFARVSGPRGLDVAADGTVYVVDSGADRVLRLGRAGGRLGYLRRTAGDLYDVQAARGGVVYVLEAGAVGVVRRIGRDGTVTTVSTRHGGSR
jgi:streptogramin lyase